MSDAHQLRAWIGCWGALVCGSVWSADDRPLPAVAFFAIAIAFYRDGRRDIRG